MGIIKLKKANEEEKNSGLVGESLANNTAAYSQLVENKTAPVEQWDDPAVLYEDETRIDESSRHYILNNGTTKSIFHAESVNFFDEAEKKWKNIDNSLEEKDEEFESKNGKVKTRISKAHKGKKVAISKKDKQISWEYLGKQVTGGTNETLKDIAGTVLRVNNGTQGEAKNVNSSAIYENIEKDTDLEYRLIGNNLKENIIVKEKATDYRYLFALKTEGLQLRLSEDNESLEVYSEEKKEDGTVERKVEFTIPSPYMYDANGVSSDDVYYELEPSKERGFIFAVIANEEWVNAPDRAFPIVIDPQIVTNNRGVFSKQVQCRNYSTGSGSGASNGDWMDVPHPDIKVYKDDYIEYRTRLTIKRSLMNLPSNCIVSVKLILTPDNTFSGTLGVNNYYKYYDSTQGNLVQDITSKFKSYTSDFTINIEPASYSYAHLDAYFSWIDNPPVLEVEYLTNENMRPTKKTFTLAGIATGEVDLANGSIVTSICDVKPENSVMGMGIYHIHKRNAENYAVGGNFRLNLNETLIKHTDGDYIYTDANGDKHGFRDYYYYVNESGAKTYITNKSLISVDAEGCLTYTTNGQTYFVTCEYKSSVGLKATTMLEGVKNVEFFEQRSDEIKQNQDSLDSYYAALKDYVIVHKFSGTISYKLEDYLDEGTDFSEFLNKLNSASHLLLNTNDAIGYHSLIEQQNSCNYSIDADDIIPDERTLNENFLSVKYSLYEITETLLKYLEDPQHMISEGCKGNLISLLETNSIITRAFYIDLPDQWETENGDIRTSDEFELLIRKRNLYIKQLDGQTENLETQVDLINEQIQLYYGKKEYNIQVINKYYREYIALLEKQKSLEMQMPVSFLSDGHYIKGFNAEGKFVALYDRYENYAVIEYESYYAGTTEKSRIARVYDNTEKQVVFSYNDKNQLAAITDTRGRRTCFAYSGSNLRNIAYDTGENLTIEYVGNNIFSLEETKNKLMTYIDYSYNRPIIIEHHSLAAEINVNGATLIGAECGRRGYGFISCVTIDYNSYNSNPIFSTTVTENLVREKYDFDGSGNCIEYRKAEFDVESNYYLVTAAEQYEYVPYWNGATAQENPRFVRKTAKKSSGLYEKTMDTYTFPTASSDYDQETTTLDQFNNAELMTTSAILVSEWTNENDVKQQTTKTTTVNYTYDDNQKLIQERMDVAYSNRANPIVSYKKYNYNAYGDVVRVESYVQDEEYTTGKTIEETVYDDKGNVIKSFTYNSLDASSKFYTETEYDENGKVVATLDGTGENKTRFGYVDGTSAVREEVLPNGSKFAYGRDYDDTVTAISQSTEEGEENSTQKVYRYGELVELRSGNNNVKYAYDSKRRLKAVELNGVENYVQYAYTEMDSYDEIATTNANNQTLTVKKDKRGNILSNVYSNGTSLIYAYDEKNRLKSVTETDDDEDVRTFKYTYDSLDNVLTYNEKEGVTTKLSETYTYNTFGQVDTIILNTGMQYKYTYSEDSTRKLEEISVAGLTITPKYDILNRNKGKEICIGTNKISEEQITYRKVGDHATNMPSTVRFGNKVNGQFVLRDSIKYAYDAMGNITTIYENGKQIISYEYDKLNRLVRENNKKRNETKLFAYDNNGNILLKEEYDYTVKAANELGTAKVINEYCYKEDSDQLLRIIKNTLQSDGNYAETIENFVYDETIGNPTTYHGKTATWTNGRRLASYDGHTFTYDTQGRRIAKGNISFTYDSNGRVVKQSNDLEFFYDHTGVAGLKYGGSTYVYRKDAQGNIIAIINQSGNVVVEYTYDAWGNHTFDDISGVDLGNLNPFRYKSYYYDTETDLYFLKTRYYDPEIGRFMTIDGIEYLDPETINGLNLYAYCLNNPVMRIDPNGTFSWLLLGLGLLLFTPVGGTVVQAAISAVSYVGMAAVAGVDYLINGETGSFYRDMNSICWNPFNTSETDVLNSNNISFYKGVPVFRTASGGRSGSFGAIFLTRDSVKDDLYHERGHNWQLMMMGIGTYGFTVGIPSPLKLGKWDKKGLYYYAPWETMADILGGVTKRYGNTIPPQQITNAWVYYAISMLCFPFTALYWL